MCIVIKSCIIINRLSTCRLLLLSVPSIQYGFEVWEGNKGHANAFKSIVLKGAKRILGCSSKACNEAVKGDMGLEMPKSRRVKMVVQVRNNA